MQPAPRPVGSPFVADANADEEIFTFAVITKFIPRRLYGLRVRAKSGGSHAEENTYDRR